MAGYNEDSRTEANQNFEYVGKSAPLVKIHVNTVSSITSTHPFHPVPLVERLHFPSKEQY